ncbi:ThuA domain-containing protein [Litorivivens sp.]|uniref:ThuA domain-containing protein n=1 Tax=Litorivivens sp. TaxID=2020868 RepID=UPI003564B3CA
MKTWLKRILLSLMVLVVGAVGYGYYQLKSVGLIPRKDYDTVAPVLPEFKKPAVLVFTKTNGFIHKDAIPVAKQVFKSLIEQQGWQAYLTDNAAVHSPELLKRFDFIIWNNVSGDVLTAEQRTAMKTWIENGGGWLGVHASGGDFSYDWEWYVQTLIGAQFIGHTMDPQFQNADVIAADPSLLITAHLPKPWRVKQEEWYAFDQNVRDKGYEVLLTLDESSYHTAGETWLGNDSMPGEHPIAWRHTVGKGRVFYSAIGHQPATYEYLEYQAFLRKAMHWVRGRDGDQ